MTRPMIISSMMVFRSGKRFLIITSKVWLIILLLESSLNQIKNFSFIRLWGNVVYKVEKSLVDKLVAYYVLHPNVLLTKTYFSQTFHTRSPQIEIEIAKHYSGFVTV